jgi:hypothetical protein
MVDIFKRTPIDPQEGPSKETSAQLQALPEASTLEASAS